MKVRVQNHTAQDIKPGMFACFSKTIGPADVAAYTATIGDISPLHVDVDYGVATGFGGNLVHGMFTSSLFSTLVGVFLPGRNALLGSVNLDFVRPVPVGSRVIVTASVVSILPDGDGFKLRLLACVDGSICVRGEALVNVRPEAEGGNAEREVDLEEVWEGRPDDLGAALVTGATGLIGRELCLKLAGAGWRIGVHYHQNRQKARELLDAIEQAGSSGCLVQCDLAGQSDDIRKIVVDCRDQIGPMGLLVHAACPTFTPGGWLQPAIDSSLIQVQLHGLRAMLPEVLPDMLRAQYGHILAVTSDAVHPPYLPGWQDYVAAKYALQGMMGALAAEYDGSGLCIGCISPGALRGDSSLLKHPDDATVRALRQRWPLGILPSTLADAVLNLVDKQDAFPNGSVLAFQGVASPHVQPRALLSPTETPAAVPDLPAEVAQDEAKDTDPVVLTRPNSLSEQLRDVFQKVLHTEDRADLEHAVLGKWPGWDSLNHLKLLMEVEKTFTTTLKRPEELYSFQQILAALLRGSE